METQTFIKRLFKIAQKQQIILQKLAQKATIQNQIMELVRKVADGTPNVGPEHQLKILKIKYTPPSRDKTITIEENWMVHVGFNPKLDAQQSNDFINAFNQAALTQLPETQV